MPYAPQIERLAAIWREQPRSTAFAPLADALRKAGATADALELARAGVTARPDFLPGHLVLARVLIDGGARDDAERVLRAALTLDHEHPVIAEMLRELTGTGQQLALTAGVAPVLEPVAPAAEMASPPTEWSVDESRGEASADAASESDEMLGDESPHEPLITESLALLYRDQGHLDRALDAFEQLVQRHPANINLAARRDGVRAELEAQRPRPYAASRSGGTPVAEWLQAIAAASAPPPRSTSGFDAFYEAPAGSAVEAGDLAAFQSWLRELDR
ncbi:MAG TPA: tetratricopeptide repeat protein [Gemmatimonadales bacterium]|jgi:predicted Zn-dependent protease